MGRYKKRRKALFCWLSNSMNTLLVSFGDSWTFGSELDLPRDCNWTTVLGNQQTWATLNLSCPASSIGHLTVQLFQYLEQAQEYHDYKKIFMVGLSGTTRYLSYSNQLNEFVNITPEANYRTGDIHFSGRPPGVVNEFNTLAHELYSLVECTEYNQFILQQTIMLFENYCKLNNIDVIFFSYFDYLYNSSLNYYPESLTKTLTGQEYSQPDIRNNKYFAGKLFHPNQLGHQRIAEILLNFYDKHYTRN
jgi:lysophospholipase L1-like esterase